jgi:hypothetical protein
MLAIVLIITFLIIVWIIYSLSLQNSRFLQIIYSFALALFLTIFVLEIIFYTIKHEIYEIIQPEIGTAKDLAKLFSA